MLTDPLAITATFIVGSASGVLLTHLTQTRAIAGFRKLLKPTLLTKSHRAESIARFAMKALVIARDPEMISVLSQLFSERRISTQACLSDSAVEQLSSDKFAAMVMDFDQLPGCAHVVDNLPRANEGILVIAVASNSMSKATASRCGAKFIVERPLNPERLRDLLAMSYGRMLRDSQVYFRLAIELAVTIRGADGKLRQCSTLNISQTGMAVNTPEAFSVGEAIHLAFAIPNTDIFVSAEGKVIWDDKHGKSGINFECTSPSVHGPFREWLHDHFHKKLETNSLPDTREVSYAG